MTHPALTPETLAKLKSAAETATPGPWACQGGSLNSGINWHYHIGALTQLPEDKREPDDDCDGGDVTIIGKMTYLSNEQNRANGEYVALANPAVILALLAEREAQASETQHQKTIAEAAIKVADERFETIKAQTARIAELEATLGKIAKLAEPLVWIGEKHEMQIFDMLGLSRHAFGELRDVVRPFLAADLRKGATDADD